MVEVFGKVDVLDIAKEYEQLGDPVQLSKAESISEIDEIKKDATDEENESTIKMQWQSVMPMLKKLNALRAEADFPDAKLKRIMI